MLFSICSFLACWSLSLSCATSHGGLVEKLAWVVLQALGLALNSFKFSLQVENDCLFVFFVVSESCFHKLRVSYLEEEALNWAAYDRKGSTDLVKIRLKFRSRIFFRLLLLLIFHTTLNASTISIKLGFPSLFFLVFFLFLINNEVPLFAKNLAFSKGNNFLIDLLLVLLSKPTFLC